MAAEEAAAVQPQQETPALFRAVMQGLMECHEWGYFNRESCWRDGTTNDRTIVAREFVLGGREQPEEPTKRIDAYIGELVRTIPSLAERGFPREIIQYLGTMSSAQAMREAISLETGIPAAGVL